MWCNLWKPVTCRKRRNCKIKEINIIILMFFFIFYGLWTSVTFDTNIRGNPSKKFWKENISNFQIIWITQYINFVPCDRFSQITSHIRRCYVQVYSDIMLMTEYSFVCGVNNKVSICIHLSFFHQCHKLKEQVFKKIVWYFLLVYNDTVFFSWWCGRSVSFLMW